MDLTSPVLLRMRKCLALKCTLTSGNHNENDSKDSCDHLSPGLQKNSVAIVCSNNVCMKSDHGAESKTMHYNIMSNFILANKMGNKIFIIDVIYQLFFRSVHWHSIHRQQSPCVVL